MSGKEAKTETKFAMQPVTINLEQLRQAVSRAPTVVPKTVPVKAESKEPVEGKAATATMHVESLDLPVNSQLTLTQKGSQRPATSFVGRRTQADPTVSPDTLEGTFHDLVKLIFTKAGSAGLGVGWWNLIMDEKQRAERGQLTDANFNERYTKWLNGKGLAFLAEALVQIRRAPDDAPAAKACARITMLDVVRSPKTWLAFADLVKALHEHDVAHSSIARSAAQNAAAMTRKLMLVKSDLTTASNVFYASLVHDSSTGRFSIGDD